VRAARESDEAPTVPVPEGDLAVSDLAEGDAVRIAVLPPADGGDAAGATAGVDRAEEGDGSALVEEGDRLRVKIDDVGDQGDGIARIGPGYVVFVPGTDVGDSAAVEITEVRENYAFAEVVD